MNEICSLILAMFIGLPAGGSLAVGPSADLSELKARFRERQEALERLEDQQRIGETAEGLVEVVRSKYADESVHLGGGRTMLVGRFVDAENADRRKLYQRIAERTGESVQTVAEQAALRHFNRAEARHYLKLRDGRWVLKKNLPK